MKIETWSIDRPKPYGKNPRVIPGAAVDAVAASLKEFGWRQPIVVDEQDVILAGHTRLLAARKLGMAEVPVHVAVGLTKAQAKAFRIADNKSATFAEFDFKLLPDEFAALRELDYDLGKTLFAADEIAEIMAPAGTEGLTDPDAVPEVPKTPVSKTGDLWLLGAHTVCPHCGEKNDL